MIFQRVNRTDPERVFVVHRNNANATLAKDQTVALELNASSVDGVLVDSVAAAANLWTFVGIADAAITDGSYGLIQVYGYRSTSIILQTNVVPAEDITAGHPLVPVAAQSYLAASTTSQYISSAGPETTVFNLPFFAVILESFSSTGTSATLSRKIFIRAL